MQQGINNPAKNFCPPRRPSPS